MTTLWDIHMEGITPITVTITGQMISTGSGSGTWSGKATATEPLVAISLGHMATYLQWAKSDKYTALSTEYTTLPITITLDPIERFDSYGLPVQHLTLAVTRLSVGGWVHHPHDVVQQMQEFATPFSTQTGRFTLLVGHLPCPLAFVRTLCYALSSIISIQHGGVP